MTAFGLAILAPLAALVTVAAGLVVDTCTQGSTVVDMVVAISLPLWIAPTLWVTALVHRIDPLGSVTALGAGVGDGRSGGRCFGWLGLDAAPSPAITSH